MTRYKVGIPGGWKRGFKTIETASEYAGRLFRKSGIVSAVEAYQVAPPLTNAQKDRLLREMGLVKVRGDLGGIYWE